MAVSAPADLDATLSSPGFLVDPYPVFARFRNEAPLYWVEAWNCWLMTRGADIDTTIRDTRRFRSSERMSRIIEMTPGFSHERLGALHENFRVGIAQLDPPDHGRVRGIVASAFTPRRVDSLRDRIQAHVDEMIDAVLARPAVDGVGRMELVGDLAFALPAIVIAEMAGFPVEDRDRFRDWTWRINQFFFRSGSVDPAHGDDSNLAILEARAWIHPLVEDRRQVQRDDLLSALVAAEFEGGRLSEAELLSLAITLFLGGHETTTGLIALGMNALVRHPDQLALLQDRPDLAEAAVEEMLRYDAPFQMNLRLVGEDVEMDGVTLREGDLVRQALGSANRDPERFEEPDRFWIDRPSKRHLAFGLGPHFCIGAPLARAQAEIAVETLVRRLPNLRLDPDADSAPDLMPDITNRGLRTLRLAFDAP
jgi:pimeloyl-[acyl-carrier protein] synthase